MFNLNEILMSAQGGQAIGNLARQFNLSPQQAQSAMEALLPAFSMGLANQASTGGFADLFGKVAGAQTTAYDDPSTLEDESARQQGNDLLGSLFGTKEMSRQVAQHAADMSGLSAGLLKQMLPVIASMIMGGLLKSFTGGAQAGGASGGLPGGLPGGLGDILGQMMGGARGGGGAPGGGLGDILGGVLGGMLGGGMAGGTRQPEPRQPEPREAPAEGGLGGVFGDILGQMMGGGARGPAGAGEAGAEPLPGGRGDAFQAQLDSLSEIFQSGVETSRQQQQGLQDIFSQMFGKR